MAADVDRHQAFLSIQQGRADVVLASSAASLAAYRRLDMAWPTAASLLLSAFGSLMTGDTASATRNATEALGILLLLGDSWGMVHAEAMLGGIAQAEHRLDDAARALRRAADESAIMGFLGQAALHRASLARVQHRLRDPAATESYERAIDDATAGGDGRLAATARLNLARMLRSTGQTQEALTLLEVNEKWYEEAGGGEYSLLSHCLLSAERRDSRALEAALAEGRSLGNVEVEVCALDALARLAGDAGHTTTARARLAEADGLARQVAHLLDEGDRVDALTARRLCSA
jgi:hypothetical protein